MAAEEAVGGVAFRRSTELGARVLTRRRMLGYRFAKDFAGDLGWNPSVLSRLEAGQRDVYERDLDMLCRHLQVLPAWFEGDDAAAVARGVSVPVLLEYLIARRREEIATLERMADLLRGDED